MIFLYGLLVSNLYQQANADAVFRKTKVDSE